MINCKDCKFWSPLDNDSHKGVCKHPERNDKKSVHYYGFIKADDYCAVASKKVNTEKQNGRF